MERVVLGIVQREDMFLLVQRKKDDGIDWSFPGGTIEIGETEYDAVVREVLEETNIVCHVIKKIGERLHPISDKHVSYLFCEYVSGEIKINENEVVIAIWKNKDDVVTLFGDSLFDAVGNIIYT